MHATNNHHKLNQTQIVMAQNNIEIRWAYANNNSTKTLFYFALVIVVWLEYQINRLLCSESPTNFLRLECFQRVEICLTVGGKKNV